MRARSKYKETLIIKLTFATKVIFISLFPMKFHHIQKCPFHSNEPYDPSNIQSFFFSYANICCKRSIAIVLNTVSNRLFELTQRLLMTFRGIAKIQFRAFYGGSKAKRRWANPNQGGLDLFKIINDAGSRAFVRQINIFTLLFALCPFSSVRCRWTVSLGVV